MGLENVLKILLVAAEDLLDAKESSDVKNSSDMKHFSDVKDSSDVECLAVVVYLLAVEGLPHMDWAAVVG